MRIKNSKVHTINISLNSGASASNKGTDVLHKRRKIFRDKKNKPSTMAGTFITTSVTELPEINPTAEIYTKCHLTNK